MPLIVDSQTLRSAAEELWEDAWHAAFVAEGWSDRGIEPLTKEEAIEKFVKAAADPRDAI